MTARGRERQEPDEGATDTEILGAAAAGIARRGHLTSGLAHALAACLRRPGISRCAIYLYGPGGLEPHVAEGFVGEDWLRFFDRKTLFGSIADLGEPQFSRPGDGSPLPDTGVVSTAAFPIPGPAAHVGILVVGSDTLGLDAPDARAFLAAFAAVLGQACGMSLAMTELRAAERRYGLILGEAADAILVVGEQGRVLEGSHSAAQLLGVEPRALAGRPLDELLDGALPGDLLPRVLENKHVALDKIGFRHPDGTERVLDLTASRADVGIERILFVVLRDVTERTRALEALSESESRFRALVRSMNDVVFTTDTEARVTGLYGGAAGRGAGTAGDAAHPMLPSFERASTATAFRRVLAGEVVSFDWTSQREGQTFHTETTLSPLLGPSNEPAGVVGVSRDVSELRRAQTMMVFGDRLRTLGLLSAGLAHEINNPLAALVMSLDAMDDARTRGADMGEIVAEARAAASHVRAIVSDLRIFGRRDEPTPGPVDVERILDSAVRMAHHELRDRVRIARRYRSVPAALGTEAKLGQVFLNLLVNAAQAIGGAKKGGLVTLETTDLGDGRVAIDVIDDGPGIPAELLPQIFVPSFTTKEGQGTGLGLSISSRIVRALGGEIVVDTEVGKGTTFRVILPRAPSRRESVVPASVHPTQSRGRILVVDDEPLILRTVTRSLSRDHDVVTASNAREALARIESGERFDVILCDVMMPEMTGLDFLETLTRDIPELADRLVFLSGGASSPALRDRVERVPNLCLEKPFEPAELKRAIRDKMRAKESAPR